MILDVSDLANPQVIRKSSCISNLFQDVVIARDYDNLAVVQDGLRIFDISKPDNGIGIEAYETNESANGLVIKDNHTYVVAGETGLLVIDIKNSSIIDKFNKFSNVIQVDENLLCKFGVILGGRCLKIRTIKS